MSVYTPLNAFCASVLRVLLYLVQTTFCTADMGALVSTKSRLAHREFVSGFWD